MTRQVKVPVPGPGSDAAISVEAVKKLLTECPLAKFITRQDVLWAFWRHTPPLLTGVLSGGAPRIHWPSVREFPDVMSYREYLDDAGETDMTVGEYPPWRHDWAFHDLWCVAHALGIPMRTTGIRLQDVLRDLGIPRAAALGFRACLSCRSSVPSLDGLPLQVPVLAGDPANEDYQAGVSIGLMYVAGQHHLCHKPTKPKGDGS